MAKTESLVGAKV
jgi:chromosome segregation ATPase